MSLDEPEILFIGHLEMSEGWKEPRKVGKSLGPREWCEAPPGFTSANRFRAVEEENDEEEDTGHGTTC